MPTTRAGGWHGRSLAVACRVFLFALACMVAMGCQDNSDDGGDPAVGGQTINQTVEQRPASQRSEGEFTGNRPVVAVVDTGFNPYHLEMRSTGMALDGSASPETWLTDFSTSSFSDFSPLKLTVSADSQTSVAKLLEADSEEWAKATGDSVIQGKATGYWIPGSKIIAAVSLGPLQNAVKGDSRGAAMASAVAGKLHGTCPSCLVVYVNAPGADGLRWAAEQHWIDVQVNAWHLGVEGRAKTANLNSEPLVAAQRTAVDRGQAVFTAAGNGQLENFLLPNATYSNALTGPDWITTVGAVNSRTGGRYAGSGRPVDIAATGNNYPTGTGEAVGSHGQYSGTEIATAIVAGLYAEALFQVRLAINSHRRIQQNGVVAVGDAGCAAANPDCPASDGVITQAELISAIFHAGQVVATPLAAPEGSQMFYVPASEQLSEDTLSGRGHGVFYGKSFGNSGFRREIGLIVGFVMGEWHGELQEEMRDWFIADSACRQHLYGGWPDGYAYGRNPPAPSPLWPMRSLIATGCPLLPVAN